MHVDWAALGIVAVVSIAASVILRERHTSGLSGQDQVEPGRVRHRDRLAGLCLNRHRRAARTLLDLPDRSAVPRAGFDY